MLRKITCNFANFVFRRFLRIFWTAKIHFLEILQKQKCMFFHTVPLPKNLSRIIILDFLRHLWTLFPNILTYIFK